uniref:GATA-type domain-containing protein n=1 Tax=Mycena chlorophos TaxID=658473 RepID=A0ABQ0LAU3_MYCCL|nr:predicted protein [Mycena chlorophos]
MDGLEDDEPASVPGSSGQGREQENQNTGIRKNILACSRPGSGGYCTLRKAFLFLRQRDGVATGDARFGIVLGQLSSPRALGDQALRNSQRCYSTTANEGHATGKIIRTLNVKVGVGREDGPAYQQRAHLLGNQRSDALEFKSKPEPHLFDRLGERASVFTPLESANDGFSDYALEQTLYWGTICTAARVGRMLHWQLRPGGRSTLCCERQKGLGIKARLPRIHGHTQTTTEPPLLAPESTRMSEEQNKYYYYYYADASGQGGGGTGTGGGGAPTNNSDYSGDSVAYQPPAAHCAHCFGTQQPFGRGVITQAQVCHPCYRYELRNGIQRPLNLESRRVARIAGGGKR